MKIRKEFVMILFTFCNETEWVFSLNGSPILKKIYSYYKFKEFPVRPGKYQVNRFTSLNRY